MVGRPDGLVKRWLMERVGHGEAPLKEVWVAPIAQLFLDGEWDESDILKTHGGRDGAREVWSKILDECHKTVGEVSRYSEGQGFAVAAHSLSALFERGRCRGRGHSVTPSRVTKAEVDTNPSVCAAGLRVPASVQGEAGCRSSPYEQ